MRQELAFFRASAPSAGKHVFFSSKRKHCRFIFANKHNYGSQYSLFKQWEINKEFWDVNHTLQIEVVLAAKEWVLSFLLECNSVNLVAKRVGVCGFQTLSGEE